MIKKNNSSIYSVIDVGTNNILLLIAKRGAELEIIARDSATSALGKNMQQNYLQQAALQRAKKILAAFISQSLQYQARIIIIGTSCSREAKNIAELSDWLWDKYRLPYQIISGAEEAYFNGLANQAEFPEAQKLLLFDLGGGSTEFTLLQAEQILRAESVNIGIRRFESEFGNDYAALKARVLSLLPTFSATEKADLTLVVFELLIHRLFLLYPPLFAHQSVVFLH
ncbi:MAG: hypothetical protein R6U84_02835 [Candidatus Cloacimonadales bacterium]